MKTYSVATPKDTHQSRLSGEAKIRAAAHAVLDGHSRGLQAMLPFLGPAFIACVAYIDPGNYVTNIQGGSAFGYNLLWVIALANLMAILLQSMSAKLGLATGKNLAELLAILFPGHLFACLCKSNENRVPIGRYSTCADQLRQSVASVVPRV